MRVVKKGLREEDRLYRLPCDKCGAVIECAKKELPLLLDIRDGNAFTLNCPECKAKTYFAVEVLGKYAHSAPRRAK